MPEQNPFATPRESRSVTLTFRMTPTEHETVKTIAARDGVEIVDLIREGLGLVIDKRSRPARPRR